MLVPRMNSSNPRPRLHSLLREPLVHFAAIGLTLFAVEALAGRVEHPRRIVVESALVRELAEDFERQEGRAPSTSDIEAMIDRWIEEEVLYREALELRLDREDPRIRQRLASKMAFVLEQRRPVPKPTLSDLRTWFEEHAADYESPLRVDFTHVFVLGDDATARRRAEELRTMLQGGASPSGLGDTFSGGRRYRRRTLPDLERAFGEGFTDGLVDLGQEEWTIRESRHGVHVVHLDGIHAAEDGDFEAQRLRIEQDWIDAQRAAITREETASLLEGWEIVRP